MLAFPSDTRDLGPVKMNGKTYEHYQFYDSILKVIHMDTQDWYVDNSGSKPCSILER